MSTSRPPDLLATLRGGRLAIAIVLAIKYLHIDYLASRTMRQTQA